MSQLDSEVTALSGNVPLLQDPECYAYLLRFYDGICQWEEGSSTPVLHVGWAHHMVFSLSRFDAKAREQLEVHAEGEEDEEEKDSAEEGEEEEEGAGEKEKAAKVKDKEVATMESPPPPTLPLKRGCPLPPLSRRGRGRPPKKRCVEGMVGNVGDHRVAKGGLVSPPAITGNGVTSSRVNGQSDEDHIKSTIEELESKVGAESQNETPNPNIAALAHACGESILNPEYLISGGEPFTTASASPFSATVPPATTTTTTDTKVDFNEFLSSKSNGSPFPGMTMDSMLKAESPADMMLYRRDRRPCSSRSETDSMLTKGTPEIPIIKPELMLCSAKMKGLKSLLTSSGKLNASAIKLQLTAQSQVHLKHTKMGSEQWDYTGPRKRTRREWTTPRKQLSKIWDCKSARMEHWCALNSSINVHPLPFASIFIMSQ